MPTIKDFSKEIKKQICEEYLSDVLMKSILGKYRITQYTLYKILKENSIVFDKKTSSNNRTFNLIEEDIRIAVCEDYKNGMKRLDLQAKYKLSQTNVIKIIKNGNVYVSKLQGVENKISKIIDLYNTGLSPEKIARELHMSSTFVTSYLRNSGIILRNPTHYHKKYKCDETYLDSIDSFDKAQIIGMLTADGFIEKKKYTLNLNLQEDDLDYLEWVKIQFKSDYPIALFRKQQENFVSKQGKIYNVKNHYKFSVNSPHLHSTIQKYNIVHRKSYANLGLPSEIPSQFIKAFTLGVMEGDGSVGVYADKRLGRKYVYGVCSFLLQEQLAEDLSKVIHEQLGIICKIRKKNEKLKMISFYAADELIKLYHWFYDDAHFVMKRKHDKFTKIMNVLFDKGYDVGELRNF